MADATPNALTALRGEIDRIDEAMHRLLMERGSIIDRLIATKGTVASGSAFRPEREASMMKTLVERHEGRLPVEAVEGIWRVIISTFTYVQAPFSLHADAGADSDAMRDSARFHFGFTVPYRTAPDADGVVAAVSGSRGDLGLVAPASAKGAWWRTLEPVEAPKIIARLPFVAHPGHPAALPVLLVAKSVSGEGLGAIRLYAARGLVDPNLVTSLGGETVAECAGDKLVAIPSPAAGNFEANAAADALTSVGSYPA